MNNLSLSHYDYVLPPDRIAQEPHHPADEAKLLVCGSGFDDARYVDLPGILSPQSVLFFNDTKVMQSRILVQWKAVRLSTGVDTSIDAGEIFVYTIVDDHSFEALVADGKHYRPWSRIIRNDDVVLDSVSFTQEWILFRLSGITVEEFMHNYGQLPLPPYITYTKDKEEWYQTCFAKYMWSAAAPTASLHFTPRLLQDISRAGHCIEYATLHVGLGTFKPVYQEDIRKHDIHQEMAMIGRDIFTRIAQYKQQWQQLVAVGTTMMRLLESLPYVWKLLREKKDPILSDFSDKTVLFWDALVQDIDVTSYIMDSSLHSEWQYVYFRTKIFIYPGFVFRIVDQLITNFHLPKSSLLMLVWACMGERWKESYNHALSHDYMFYSFGDGMWIQDIRGGNV